MRPPPGSPTPSAAPRPSSKKPRPAPPKRATSWWPQPAPRPSSRWCRRAKRCVRRWPGWPSWALSRFCARRSMPACCAACRPSCKGAPMAELATIARPYAEALFKATTGAGVDPVSAAAWLDELAAIADRPELRPLAGNPKVTADQVFALFTQVLKDAARAALPQMARNFLPTLITNRRINVLTQVAQQFRALLNRRNGFSDAVVYSAFPMDSAALSEVGAALQKRF